LVDQVRQTAPVLTAAIAVTFVLAMIVLVGFVLRSLSDLLASRPERFPTRLRRLERAI
jgi:hypothetical protein